MLNESLFALVVPATFLVIIVVVVSIVTRVRKGLPWERKRKSPFTNQFLRSPGHSVLHKLDDLRLDIFGDLFGVATIPLMFVSSFFIQSEMSGKPHTTATTLIYVVSIAAVIIVLILRLIKTTRKAQRMRLGYEAELAVGQELNQLMTQGFRVYHDFPADVFNIDHIVIGPTGVFAVETKGRSKPDTGNGRADAKVVYDGESLNFPHWNETKPIEQARIQSRWLSKWLSSAVGEQVGVIPVLAIPGWFIDQKGRSDVLAFYGKNPESLFAKCSNGANLSAQMIQRIAHQVEAKCRDIDSKAFVDDKT